MVYNKIHKIKIHKILDEYRNIFFFLKKIINKVLKKKIYSFKLIIIKYLISLLFYIYPFLLLISLTHVYFIILYFNYSHILNFHLFF